MNRSIPLALLLLCLVLAGCSKSSDGPQPIKEGDYTTQPGGAEKK